MKSSIKKIISAASLQPSVYLLPAAVPAMTAKATRQKKKLK